MEDSKLPLLVTRVWQVIPILLIILPALCQVPGSSKPLRLEEGAGEIAADLQSFISGRLTQGAVPGLSIALIRDHRIVWEEGFGYANAISGKRVSADTVFEVASNTKALAALVALRLVDQGRLSLDEPCHKWTVAPWLPPSAEAGRITIRHLASHSSGLSDDLFFRDKTLSFEPGTEFRYSGLGFLYLQSVLEQSTGESLEELSQRLVFQPLGMTSSSLVNSEVVRGNMASGHLNYQLPLLIFLIPLLLLSVVSVPIAALASRVTSGRWRPGSRAVFMLAAALAVAVFLLLLRIGGTELPHLLFLSVQCFLAFVIGTVLLSRLGWRLIRRSTSGPRRGVFSFLKTAWVLLVVVSLLSLSGLVIGPAPNWPSPPASAVGSLRTSAGDLALLLIELARPQLLSKELGAQIRTPQVTIDDRFSWGLGIGIQHSDAGDALWQNGNTFGFQSLMVIYPSEGIGVVVLTNGQRGKALADDVAQRALGGPAHWRFF